MEGTNTFEKGLHRSNSPQMQPEGSYVDAYNWIRNDSGRMTNEELEEVLPKLGSKYKYLGSCPIKDKFICFFREDDNNSEIGIFDTVTKQYTSIFNDSFASYDLNFGESVDSIARITPTDETIVYFVDNVNPPRRFNITEFQNLGTSAYTSSEYNTVEDWNLQLTFKMPYANYRIERNGSVPTGTYSFAFRYVTNENNKSTFNIPSRFINIGSFVNASSNGSLIYDDEITGALPQSVSNQSIVMSLKNLDFNYPFIEVVVITYLGVTNVLSVKSIGLYEIKDNLEITFSTTSQYLNDVSESSLLEMPVNLNSASCIEQKDNILILSNITTKKYDKDFQKIANKIELYWSVESLEVDNRRNILLSADNWPSAGFGGSANRKFINLAGFDDQGTDVNPVFDKNFQKSNAYADPLILKGFQRGEVYSFSITPIYKDGSIGFAYHIPGKNWGTSKPFNALSAWESELKYLTSYASDDDEINLQGYIRHHQMPDYDETGYIGDETFIRPLRVTAKNINFTDEQLKNIQGYIIGFQPRNNDITTRIIDTGFTRPYLKNEKNDEYIGTLWTGSVFHREGAGGGGNTLQSLTWQPRWDQNPYAMYHSPDSLLDRQKIRPGYKIQRIGYGKNLILHAGLSGFQDTYKPYLDKGPAPYYVRMTLPVITKSIDSSTSGELYANLFFEFNNFYFNKGNIVDISDSRYIPFVGEDAPIIIDGKINIKAAFDFVHLETIGSHFFDEFSQQDFPGQRLLLAYQYLINQISDFLSNDRFLIHSPNDKGDVNSSDYENRGLGINLCRIINDNKEQYSRLESAEYTPCAVFIGENSFPTEILLEGDTYISKYFFNMYEKLLGKTEETVSGKSLMGVYVESKNNYALRHTEDGKVPFYPNYKYIENTDNTNTGLFNLDWWKVTTGYNKQYSSLSNARLTFPKPLFFEEITKYSNRSVYSNQSFESELIDQYRIFPANNFHDIPRHRGIITDTFVFNNNFFHHTEYGLWLSYFNPNTTQATSQGEVVLGNAGIFRIPSKLVLDIKGGYMGTADKSGTNTPFGRVFLDHYQGKVFLFTGEAPVEISDLGLFSFFREFVNPTDKYTMGYDWANKRLLLNNISQEKAISFYPKTQTWTSFHNFSPNAYFTINGSSYAWRDVENCFYNMDNSSGVRKNSYVTIVESTSPDSFKRFDRMELNTMSGGNQGVNSPGFVEPDSYIFNDKSFTHIHCWTDRQNSKELELAYSYSYEDNFLNGYDVNKVPINYYRSSFHLELPLDAVVSPYKSIFDNNNLNLNADFRAHMKGKFLYTKLSYKDDKPLVLNYIKTFFKPSVA